MHTFAKGKEDKCSLFCKENLNNRTNEPGKPFGARFDFAQRVLEDRRRKGYISHSQQDREEI